LDFSHFSAGLRARDRDGRCASLRTSLFTFAMLFLQFLASPFTLVSLDSCAPIAFAGRSSTHDSWSCGGDALARGRRGWSAHISIWHMDMESGARHTTVHSAQREHRHRTHTWSARHSAIRLLLTWSTWSADCSVVRRVAGFYFTKTQVTTAELHSVPLCRYRITFLLFNDLIIFKRLESSV
jgi:hypothetical protein